LELNQNSSENRDSEVLFDSAALYFWKLRFDPFRRTPLQFGNEIDYEMLVKTEGILAMNDLKKQLENNPMSLILVVTGDRGSGKSTAVHYLFNSFYQDVQFIETRKILPIFCGVNQLIVENAESIRKSFHSSLLDALNKSIRELGNSVVEFRSIDLSTAYEALEDENSFKINDNIYEFLHILSSCFKKIIIFVDDLDKADPSKYDLFEEFFRGEQDFLENYVVKNNTSILITLQPFMFERFKNNKELSYFGDKTIDIQTWTKKDLNELIHRRICLAFQGDPKGCFLNHFFDPLGLEHIYQNADYTPRFVLIALKHLMQKASDLSVDKRNTFVVKPLSKAFCVAYLPEVTTNIQRKWFKIFGNIDTCVASEYSVAFRDVKELVKENEGLAREVLDALLAIWITKKTDDKKSLEILLNRRMVRPYYKNEFEVETKIGKLLSYLFNVLSQDKNQVRYYLLTKVFP
jgi:Cdc6-like AAA superfamily ATPase